MNRASWARVLATLLLLVAAPLAPVAQAAAQAAQDAQQTGTISGRIQQAATGEPIANVHVEVVGTARSTMTGRNGVFRLSQMRPGEYQVLVRSIGYRTQTHTVRVPADGVGELNVDLAATALPLDEVVVTGQPGALPRRQIASSVATIAADEVRAPVTNFSQLLQGRAAGVHVLPGGGKAGQGSRVLLRGVNSLTQDIQPIVYIDGIRIDNTTASGLDFGGFSWSGLDDLNPEDVDRIEVVRGTSAANLYGTEAAGGVIQVFTKHGRGGTHMFGFRSEFGWSDTPRDWWSLPGSEHSDWFYDTFVQRGTLHRQNISVRGAIDRFSYYVSGTVRNEDGVLPNSGARQQALRSNIRVSPTQNLSIGVSTGFALRAIDFPFDGSSPIGLTFHGLVGGPDGVSLLGEPRVAPGRVPELDVQLNSTRFTGGTTIDFALRPHFTHRLTLGADVVNSDNTELHPWGSVYFTPGQKSNYRREARTLNAEYAANFRANLSPELESSTWFGVQAYRRSIGFHLAHGERFVGPGLFTVAVSGLHRGEEDRLETRHVGVFVEEQLGWRDRLFVRVGGRVDGHSAFGPDARFRFYPKAGASYMLSEHDFLPDAVGTLRVRAALGYAGRKPEDFIAGRTWIPVDAVGSVGVTTGNIGNRALGPEVTREFEAGLDAGLFGDRIGLELTGYSQRTTGALFPIEYPPSLGFIVPQLENVGTIVNTGLELTAQTRLLELDGFRWDARVSVATNRNRVEETGDDEPLHLHWGQWIRAGYPVASFFDADGTHIGPAFPTRSVQLGSGVTVARRVTLNALVEHRGGHHLESATLALLDLYANGGEDVIAPEAPENAVYAADFWRLRELSLSWNVPTGSLRALPISAATLTLGGRNLWRSQSYPGLEAEAQFSAGQVYGSQTYFDTPLPRQVTAGVNIQF